MSIFGLAECLCPDMACVILVACHTVIVAAVVIAVEANQRRKLADMERIALELAEENVRLKKELSNEVSLPQVSEAAQGQAGNDRPAGAMPDLRQTDAAS